MQILVLAGGQGTRLWPLSRASMPKQMLSPLNEEKPLLLQTAERIEAQGILAKNIHLVTTAAQAPLFSSLWKRYGTLICEPAPKNTGPAVLLGLKALLQQGLAADEPVAVFPSDHYIENFIFKAPAHCAQKIYCYTLQPTRPETGYGYIQLEEGPPPRRVASFKEKPDAPTAKAWFEAWQNTPSEPSNKFWNAGVFVFSAQSLEHVLKSAAPEAYQLWKNSAYEELSARYRELPGQPFDVLIAERADNLYALPLPCSKWRDIGTWESVHEALAPAPGANAAAGKAAVLAASSSGCLGFSSSKKIIAFAGAHNLAVVDTGDAILVADKNNTAAMKELLELLARDYPELCQ